MRRRFAWILGMCLVCGSQAAAQMETAAMISKSDEPVETKDASSSEKPVIDIGPKAECVSPYPFWFQAEYLLWGVKDAPMPVPLVTTGDPKVGFDPNLANTVNTAGALGQPGTRVLFGGNALDYSLLAGVRMTLGGWISEDQRLGIEGSGFLFARASNRFAAVSDSFGSPPLYFPIFSAIAGAERGIPIADPLRAFSGDVAIHSNLQFAGAEANFLGGFYRGPEWDFALLAGFRYADLREGLQIHNTTRDLLFGNTMFLNDVFQTSNQFYGGQIGGRLNGQMGPLFLSVAGKLALGSVHQMVNIQGDITQAGPNPLLPPGLGTFPGGVFAQSSNMGRRNANAISVPFSVLPTLELKLGWQLTERLRAFAGYDVLYWTDVLRPGKLIDRNVNLTQNAVLDPNGTGVLVGPAQPGLVLSRSDFWAQGVNFGLEVRY